MNPFQTIAEDFEAITPVSLENVEVTEDGSSLSDTLDVALWGQLCLDLVLRPDMYQTILKDYNLSEEGMLQLFDNKAFTKRLKDKKIQVETLGPNAGFVLAARSQAEKHIVTLGKIADDNVAPHVVRVKAIENLVRYAHLDPATTKNDKDSEQRSSSGVLVQFNIGGGLLGNNRRTLEVQPLEQIDEQ